MNELPFMATENIMMDAVKKGGNRQELHEKLRVHSQAAARVVKEEGGKNDLIDRICADPAFMITREEVEAILRPEQFTGRSCEQVEEYLRDVICPLLAENAVCWFAAPEFACDNAAGVAVYGAWRKQGGKLWQF